jgi:FixJ family two-component response regulator
MLLTMKRITQTTLAVCSPPCIERAMRESAEIYLETKEPGEHGIAIVDMRMPGMSRHA